MTKSKQSVIDNFDTNAPGTSGQLFGLPFTEENADLIVIPVPWEVTVSYKAGTAQGPEAILQASAQVDLFVKDIPDAWKLGIAMLETDEKIKSENERLRQLAALYIEWLSDTAHADDDALKIIPQKINEASESLMIYVKQKVLQYLKQGKMVALLGGDHSTPLGFLRALAEVYEQFGILQIDAHADLRKAYEGFTYSHASIMYNALKIKNISKLVQVGIRDYCDEEVTYINKAKKKVKTFFDDDIKEAQYKGETWEQICERIIQELPENVYISFDIDGLDPKLCPNTGTPVPGGFELQQIIYLVKQVVKSGKKIIGLDLNEVSPGDDEWDANVGARALYQLCNWMGVSQGKLKANFN
ncbi:MAG TPA: agmatinase family protein [Cyclobacteriaceae bacterium]|nr:agmatinase family protein [Cyclobacteriaceae bacterium]